MPTVNDVAAYLLSRFDGVLEQTKMQKLLYYCQVWSVALRQEPLFPEEIQAWVNGPVVPDFWREHAYEYNIRHVNGNPARLSDPQRHLIDQVVAVYGKYSGVQLSQMAHGESPWIDARQGLPDNVRGAGVIDPQTAGAFYRQRIATSTQA